MLAEHARPSLAGSPVSDFEEYVAGRGPALVAFAVAVTGRDDAGVRLVQNALGRALAGWEGLVHDEDPDAHLRRDVVAEAARHARRPRREGSERRARPADHGGRLDPAQEARWRRWLRLPVLTRAVLALRLLEDRSWAEVAWVTDLPERAARRRAEHGLRALGDDEPTLTEALRARTVGVDALPVELSSRAARVSTRRRERAVRRGALALLLAAVGVPLLVSVWPATTGGLDLDPSPDDSLLEEVLPEGFRTESWRGVELGVPDGWGHGPLAGWCRDGDLPTPRVERPGPDGVGDGDEDCDPSLAPGVQLRLAGDPAPDVPDDLAAGERTLDGRVVLVATPDADLTEQVLATVRSVERTDSAGCAVQRAIPRAGKNFPAVETSSVALSVCRYEVGVTGPNLVQSERLSVIDSLDAREAVDAAPTVVAPQGCLDGPGEEAVVLTTADGDVAWIHLGRCQGLDDEGTHLLTPDVLFWALTPGWDGPRQDLPLPDELRGLPSR
ncbi:hypothetical protein G7072_02830 [Nocardioides sp. HDW12B]|uniref:hypothetical protein n=1 Tax=Nocardioides sp. HDW12B TaxID=2714939 RepID=UPI00140D99E1|nr:hypothetical protein [Nocardioides sp. HDW12B]QIK65413.1 hypothetical protein G7072_02830 [Nocardioides sp. HDW12B]